MPRTAAAYEEAEVENGGAVAGRVSFDGRVSMRTIIPTKDSEICGKTRREPEILVTDDKGVQQAVVYLKGVASGKAWEGATAKPELNQRNCRFFPEVQVIPRGDIDIVNSDPVLHNTHGYYGRRTAFNVALPNQGQRVSQQLMRPGVVKVDCDAHGWMLAHIFVADSPYFALTGDDGSFSISNVPPGDYTLVAWQYSRGAVETPVTVAADQAVEVNIELQ
jgi:hypothetical protein